MRFKTILVTLLLGGMLCLLGVTSALATQYNEAPMLRVKVAAGELPPVEERLPDEPLVVIAGGGEIGVYSGSMTVTYWISSLMTTEYPVNVEVPGYVKPIPNIIKAWEMNEDATEVTFFLHKGMKWSDGYPFTADDWIFWYKDIEGNTDLTPIRRTWYQIRGERGILTKIDDYTVRWTFTRTFGSFVDSMSEWPGRDVLQYAPAHYLKRFHVNYQQPNELEAKMKEEGFESWMDLFSTKMDRGNNPELPVLGAWVVKNERHSEIQIWERNPYFWKVDLEGNQLPYIDYVECPRTEGTEANLLKLIAGDLDFASKGCIALTTNFTIVMENQERGDYRPIRKTDGVGAANIGTMHCNVSHKDPVKRGLFNNLDFRKALSVAINRREVIDIALKREGIPSQVAPATGPPYFGERPEYKDYYTQHDPELANQLLDGIGLTERDDKGYRLGLDGKKLLIILQVQSGWYPEMPDIADMYKGYFAVVGLNAIVKPMPGGLIYALVDALEHDIFVRFFAGGNRLQSPANPYLFPLTASWHTAPAWARWVLTSGQQGEEPPDWVKQLAAIEDEAKAEVNMEKRIALYTKATLLHVNNLMPIGGLGTAGGIDSLFILSNRIRNVPVPMDMHMATSQLSSWYIPEERQ